MEDFREENGIDKLFDTFDYIEVYFGSYFIEVLRIVRRFNYRERFLFYF